MGENGNPQSETVAPPGHARLRLEVLVVLCLAFVPDLFYSILPFIDPAFADSWPSFELSALAIVIRSIMVVAPVLYIVHINGEGLASVGIRPPRLVIDLPLGVGIYAVDWAIYWGLAWGIAALSARPTAFRAARFTISPIPSPLRLVDPQLSPRAALHPAPAAQTLPRRSGTG